MGAVEKLLNLQIDVRINGSGVLEERVKRAKNANCVPGKSGVNQNDGGNDQKTLRIPLDGLIVF